MLNPQWRSFLGDLSVIQPTDEPFLSVYLDLRPNGAAHRESLTFLSQAILDHSSDRKVVPYHGATLTRFHEDLSRIADYMGNDRGGAYDPASHGIAFFACGARGIFRSVELPAPFENRFGISDVPLLTPLAVALAGSPDYLAVLVDVDSCRIFHVSLQTVVAEVEHQGNTANLSSVARGGGWSQKRIQRHIDTWRSKFSAESASLIDQMLDRTAAPYLMLGGEEWALAELRRHLSEPALGRIAGQEHLMVDLSNETEVVAKMQPCIDATAAMHERQVVERMLTARAEGRPIALGLEQTLRALEEGAVAELVVSPHLASFVRRCNACGHSQEGVAPSPCTGCGGPTRGMDAREFLLRSALAQDAEVVYTEHEDLAVYGEVGAQLRFPVYPGTDR